MYTIQISVIALLLPLIHAHGSHDAQKPIQKDPNESDWATLHMAEEHHIANLDPPSFFSLHDYDANGIWTKDELRRTYGFLDESTKDVSEAKKAEDIGVVLTIFDRDGDGQISRDEFVEGWMKEGKRLPDFGHGPGHHGDDEYEYEIHHFEKYHDENTKEEDLIHPEDIEHFKKHEQMDVAAERQAQLDQMSIVEENIPAKFRRKP